MTVQPMIVVRAKTRGRGRCRSCQAVITWFEVHGSGKRMPFDGEPVALQTSHDPQTRELLEHLDRRDVHWRTCPDAQQWKRGARA